MKVIKLLIVSILFVNVAQSQTENVFWESDFWKTNPTIEVIEQKIKEGNSPSALNPRGFDAVTYSILREAPNTVIKHLLSKPGNDVNKLTHDKRTYVFWAAYRDNIEIVNYLISKNARMDLKDSHGSSPLTFAAAAGVTNLDLYNLCIENGIDIKTDVNQYGANALLLLSPKVKDFEVINFFIKKGLSLKSEDNNGNNVFNYVARAGNKEMLEKLIKKGISYKGLNKNGGNAMLFASRGSRGNYNNLDFFKYLENLGIAANITNNDGVTPLHNLAYRNNDLETFNYFISKGVDANQVNKDGNTALLNAASRNNLEIITALSKNTKVINHTNKNGHSALTRALSNSPEVVSFLIKNGAEPNVIDTKGNNLAYYLIKSFNGRNLDELKQKSTILTSNGFDIKTIQKDGSTLFHLAIDANHIDLLKHINTLNIDVNAKNNDGLTALHLAAMKAKNTEIIEYLLAINANKTIKTDFEESVYDLAKENELLSEQNINFLK